MQVYKARTKIHIQREGFVEKSCLLEPLNINLGDDLQKDSNCLESATMLIARFQKSGIDYIKKKL